MIFFIETIPIQNVFCYISAQYLFLSRKNNHFPFFRHLNMHKTLSYVTIQTLLSNGMPPFINKGRYLFAFLSYNNEKTITFSKKIKVHKLCKSEINTTIDLVFVNECHMVSCRTAINH